MSLNVLVALTIVLLSSAFLIYFVYLYSIDMENSGRVEACRESIFLASQSKKFTNDPLFPLNCERDELVIKKNDVIENGEINQDKVARIMAEAMAECWYMIGEGNVDPSTNFDINGKSLCLICKTIKFDDSLKNYLDNKQKEYLKQHSTATLPNGITNLFMDTLYLYKNNMPRTSKTYAQYLYGADNYADLTDLQQTASPHGEITDQSMILMTILKSKTKKSGFFGGGFGLSKFSYCEDCDTGGYVTFATPETFMDKSYFYSDDGSYNTPICSIIIN